MKKVQFVLITLLTVLLSSNGFGADVHWASRLQGTDIDQSQQIIVDGDFANVLLNQFTDVTQFGYVRLGIEDKIQMEFRGTRTVEVNLAISEFTNSNVEQTAIPVQLIVTYNYQNGVITVDGDDYRLPNRYKFKMRVISTVVYDESNAVLSETLPDYIYLEGGIQAERYYLFDPQDIPATAAMMVQYDNVGVPSEVATPLVAGASTDEFFITWDYVDGAEYYDLEWTWVDNYSDVSLASVIAPDALPLDVNEFRHNSTRIRTSQQFYRLPNTFGRGYFVYRIRAVGRWQSAPTKDLYGEWSLGDGTEIYVDDWGGFITIEDEHEANKNWQYQATYAEDGKKKEVIQYFDGSLRGRQTVTRINSDNHSVVGETVYDNQGRGTINILPVPQANPAIQYYGSLNKNSSGDPYSHVDFDWEDSLITTCFAATPGVLGASTGAGLYYSAAGHSSDNDWQQYVPESNGFAFTQVEYTPDNTGRVRSQSGVGEKHAIGSGQETAYFYSQPSQESLNRLFGYKVGFNSRYKKNMVVDANGQVSISYLDAQGRVVATSLAGDNTTAFTSLNSETNGSHASVTADLLNNNAAVDTPEDNNDLISTGTFGSLSDGLQYTTQLNVVQDGSLYDFLYTVQSEYYEEICNETQGMKFPYMYDLTLSLTNDCGVQFFTTTYHLIGDELLSSTISEDLTAAINAIDLDQGTYTLSKTLTVNQEALETYVAEYLDFEQNDCLLNPSQFATTAATGCGFTCDECLDDLGSLGGFLQQAALDEGAALTVNQVDSYTNAYNSLVEDCMAPCKIVTPCDSYKGMMLLDLAPGGQYADVDVSDPLSIFNTSNDLTGNWRTSGITYLDSYGNPAFIAAFPDGTSQFGLTNSGNGPMEMVEPWELNLTSFVAVFESSWAEALLPYHPEYSLYLFAEDLCSIQDQLTTSTGTIDLSSSEFDAIVRDQITTYDLSNTNPYGLDFSLTAGIHTIDPYYTFSYGASTALETLKQDLLSEEVLTNYNGTSQSLLANAIKLVRTPNDFTVTAAAYASETWATLTTPEQDAVWEMYSSLYISKKAEIVQYFSDLDGFEDGIFNGCIGSDDFSLGVIGSFAQNSEYIAMVQECVNAMVAGGGFAVALCGTDYDSKIRRIVRVDGLQNTATPIEIQAIAGQATTDYIQWQQTGLCPLTVDVERLLKELGVNDLLNQTTAMADVNTFVPDLYEAITGGGVTTSSDMDIVGSLSGTTLNLDFYNVQTLSNECTISIPQIDAAYPWSTYGTTWHIYNVYNSYPTGTANDTKIIILAGAALANAEEIIVTYTTGCATLNGCQSSYAANNQNDPNCNREEEFEAAMTLVLRTLVEDGNYNNSSYNVSSLGEFSSSVLPSYFPGTVTWNGSTGTFSFSGGSYQIGFTPSTSTLYFNAYDLVNGIAYANVFTGTLGAATSSSPSGGITFTSGTTSLDFNCSCETMLNDQAFASQEIAAETAFLNLLNYVWNNNPSNESTSIYVDAFAPYTQCHVSQSALYGVSVLSSSISFGIGDVSSPPSSGTGPCGYSFTLLSSSVVSFESVDFNLNEFGSSITIITRDTRDVFDTITTYIGDQTLSALCPSCPAPLSLLPPLSCTDAFSAYSVDMNNIFESDIDLTNMVEDEQAIFDTEYIGSQEEFCSYSYTYIAFAYIYYLEQMAINSVNDPLFLTISEFGTTGLGYSSTDLMAAVDAYQNSLLSAPYYADPTDPAYLTWNEFVATVYLESLETAYCPPLMPAPYFIEPEMPEFDCNEWVNNVYAANQANQYAIYLEQIAESFKQAYIEGAMATVQETFTETHDDKEYHYTLYYYDRAGNLVSTVPPQGVDRFEANEPNTYTNTLINALRLSDPTETLNTNGSSQKMAPEHSFRTVYHYNSLNQLVHQSTPDGGESRFGYDALGRLVISQNAKQLDATTPQFSYTNYDGLGRVAEVGEMSLAGYEINDLGKLVVTSTQLLADVNASNFPSNLSPSAREEVTRTIYDELVVSGTPMKVNVTDNFGTASTTDLDADGLFENYADDNTRNRIVAVIYQPDYNASVNEYQSALFYDYDVHGNVKEMMQVYDMEHTKRYNQHIKHINYTYDLVSGNVDQVHYQKGEQDQFIHRYAYDSDNRITIAETSADGIVYEKESKYFYYDHGPLARTETGEDKVQSTDYAYTIQGWIKTVNGEEVDEATMMGADGSIATLNENNARDVFGYSLNYFEGDYASYNTSMLNFSENLISTQQTSQHGGDLYNGNIRAMYTALSDVDENAIGTHQTKYGYDQLNRIKSMTGYNATVGSPNPSFAASNYSSNYSFDDNGNLITLSRNINDGGLVNIDDFDYMYYHAAGGVYDPSVATPSNATNRLAYVIDNQTGTGTSNYGDLQHGQPDEFSTYGANYQYDKIGQLILDQAEGITQIDWKVTNKVEKITFGTGKTIEFDYDPMGNRIAKYMTVSGVTTATFYILDAQGNQMAMYEATYDSQNTPSISLQERNIYGSSRVGAEYLDNVDMAYVEMILPTMPPLNNYYAAHEVGDKRFEFSNHLGNVLQVITDRKLPEDLGSDNDVDYFTADVVSYSDYYPYGMVMPGRNGEETGAGYRYGYQGSEKDDDVKGEGNSYTTHFRQLDPRVGRWLSIDPKSTTLESPYVSMANNPIMYNDMLGDTIRGTSSQSAQRTQQTLQETFASNPVIANFFTLGSDGVTFNNIDGEKFASAIKNVDDNTKTLAYAYYEAVNDDGLHQVNMVYRSESLDPSVQSALPNQSPITIDDAAGGGINYGTGTGSLSIIVMDSQNKITDYSSATSQHNGVTGGSIVSAPTSETGELLAHELLGHGYGRWNKSKTFGFEDAIQMTNLYNRTRGNYDWRNGANHQRTGPALGKQQAMNIPVHFGNVHSFIMNNKPKPKPAITPYKSPAFHDGVTRSIKSENPARNGQIIKVRNGVIIQ